MKNLLNRFTKSNEHGSVFLEDTVMTLVTLLMAIVLLIGAGIATPALIENSKAIPVRDYLKSQGYDLEIKEIKTLIGENSRFVTSGGKGPEVTINFENVGKEKVYLFMDKPDVKYSIPVPVLKYASDDSLVASPKTIPKDSKEKW